MRASTRKTIRRGSILLALAALAAAIPALVQSAGAIGPARIAVPQVLGVVDTETFNLCADEGSVTLPAPAGATPIWGFSLDDAIPDGCADDPAQLPGPVLTVDDGDTVVVNVQNNLSEPISIVFPGQDGIVPNAIVVPALGSDTYTFTANDPGTYLYEAGTNTAVQVGMGLYGALVVKPATGAYGTAATAYNVEKVLVLSEIDPDLNDNANTGTGAVSAFASTNLSGGSPTTFASLTISVPGDDNDVRYVADAVGTSGNSISIEYEDPLAPNQTLAVTVVGTVITVSLATDGGGAISSTAGDVLTAVNAASLVTAGLTPKDFDFVGDPEDYSAGYDPTYFLINGEAYPDTNPIAALTGQDVLLRYVNAGLSHHTMLLLGDHQRVIAKDAYPLGANEYQAVAETIPAGSTLDAIVDDVATGSYPLYSRNLDVTNGMAYPGGMLTFLAVS